MGSTATATTIAISVRDLNSFVEDQHQFGTLRDWIVLGMGVVRKGTPAWLARRICSSTTVAVTCGAR